MEMKSISSFITVAALVYAAVLFVKGRVSATVQTVCLIAAWCAVHIIAFDTAASDNDRTYQIWTCSFAILICLYLAVKVRTWIVDDSNGKLKPPVDAGNEFVFGVTRQGRKSALSVKIDGTGARPGETVAIDEHGEPRVLGRKPEIAVNNSTAELESAKRRVDSWNRSVQIGSKVTYLKSELEGKVILKTSGPACIFGGQAAVELEHLGLALLSKTEPFSENQ